MDSFRPYSSLIWVCIWCRCWLRNGCKYDEHVSISVKGEDKKWFVDHIPSKIHSLKGIQFLICLKINKYVSFLLISLSIEKKTNAIDNISLFPWSDLFLVYPVQ